MYVYNCMKLILSDRDFISSSHQGAIKVGGPHNTTTAAAATAAAATAAAAAAAAAAAVGLLTAT